MSILPSLCLVFAFINMYNMRSTVDHSGSVGRAFDWGLKGYLFVSSLAGSLCCVIEQDTLSAA